MRLFLYNVRSSFRVQMNKFVILMTLTVFLGTLVMPIDGDTCTCTCGSVSQGTANIDCSSCGVSYCRTTYSGVCEDVYPVIAACDISDAIVDGATRASLATAMFASLVALIFVI
jgi:hypothetical protein